MFDFYKYIETFNAGDDKSMLDRFWVNDLEAWSGRCPRTDAGAGSPAE
jgi:hypothetical protein